MGQATDFLTAFFAGMPVGQNILVWTVNPTTQKKISHWGGSIEAAASIAEVESKDPQNVYFGVGTRRYGKHLSSDERGKDTDVAYLYALWIDIDWKSEAHAKENLPADEDEALSILEAVPFEPSILVRSGHGIQAYWLLDSPLSVGLGVEAAKKLTQRWNYTFKKFAARAGWDVDSVYDLARVMRLPGGRNVKNGGDIAVETVHIDTDLRYDLYDLMDAAIAEDAIPSLAPTEIVTGANLALSINAQYNTDKFEALCENNPDFLSRWLHKRPPGTDGSMSSYDMSIAAMAAYAGWSAQEIADLLICHRKKYKDLDTSNKAQRFDYISRTAQKAWLDAQDKEKRDAARLALMVDTPGEQATKELPAQEDVTSWEGIATALNIPIKGMIKFIGDEPTYRIVLESGTFDMGGIENITSWSRFQNRIATHIGRAIPMFKGKAWADMWSSMLMRAQPMEIADGGSAGTLYRQRLYDWLLTQTFETVECEMACVETGVVYKIGPTIYFALDDFVRWLKLIHHDSAPRAAVAKALRIIGASPKHIGVERDGKLTTRNVWKYEA